MPLLRKMASAVADCVEVVIRRLTRPIMVAGVPVWVLLVYGAERETILGNVRQALLLFEERDPGRFARLRRHVLGVQVMFMGAAGPAAAYNEKRRLCVINSELCNEKRPGDVILLVLELAHEAMHGLLADLGHSSREPLSESQRIRIERLCVMAEMLVLVRLLPPSDVRNRLESILQEKRTRIPLTYSDASRAKRRTSMAAELRGLSGLT